MDSQHQSQSAERAEPLGVTGPSRRVRGPVIAVSCMVAMVTALWPTIRGAEAQSATRARGNYLLIAGKNISNDTSQLFCLDTANQEMIALRWNPSAGQLEVAGYRSIAADRQTPLGPAGRGGR